MTVEVAKNKVIWCPLAGSQTLAMSCPAHIILYHGTRGPGKTDSQLMRFRRRVGQGYGRHWRGVIFDREYKNLDDLISKSMRWFPELNDGAGKARFLSSKSDYKWVWPTGEELLFRTVRRDADYWSYHGQEFPFIGWNELTKYPNDNLFEMMMSCNRSSFRPQDFPLIIDGDAYKKDGTIILVEPDERCAMEYLLPQIPLEVFSTCNPFGVGHNWVKKRFMHDPDGGGELIPPGKFIRKTINVFNPQTQRREDITKYQVHLFGSYRENKFLSPEYVAELESLRDPNKRKAWLGGNWDVVAGGMFDDVWDEKTHMMRPFPIPHNWKIDRSFDYGSSAPFSVGWWAESDGSDVQLADGTWISTVKGDLFRIAEWYGWTGKNNQGLRMLANEITSGIIEREIAMGIHHRVRPGAADTSIWTVENGNSIAADMCKQVRVNGKLYPGVEWLRTDKSKGSRVAGWERCRRFLDGAKQKYIPDPKDPEKKIRVPREYPGMFIFTNCRCFKDLFPNLPRDEDEPDDVDTEAEDHIGDEVRYRVLASEIGARGGRTSGV